MKPELFDQRIQDPPHPIPISREMMHRSLPPNGFEELILGPKGLAIGQFTGAVCADLNEVVAAIGIPIRILQLFEGGVLFPCAALINIYVDEEYDRQGFGSRALRNFEEISRSKQCLSALLRVGYRDGLQDNNLQFYAKNGWNRLNVNPMEIPWMSKRL